MSTKVEPLDVTRYLDEEHLAVYRMLPQRALLSPGGITAARAQAAEIMALRPSLPPNDSIEVSDEYVPSVDGGPVVLVRLYKPRSFREPRPALLWIHGGGLILGDVDMDDATCVAIAADLNITVASVEYRLAPEHPYPAPLYDCYAALTWLWRNASQLSIEQDRIAVFGISAGGGLAAGLTMLARDRAEVSVCMQVLSAPMLDDRGETHSSRALVDPKLWNRQANFISWNAYLANNAGGRDVPPYAAPARATDLRGLPPTYINIGQLDLFRDESVAFATGLMRACVPVELHVYPGAFHASSIYVANSALSRRWAMDERNALRRAIEPQS